MTQIFSAYYSTAKGATVAAPTPIHLVDAQGNVLTLMSIQQSAADNITAHAGGGQALATPLPQLLNRITVSGATDSTKLPVSSPGTVVTVLNGVTANATAVFPQTGEQINTLGVNVAFSCAASSVTIFYCLTAGQWWTK